MLGSQGEKGNPGEKTACAEAQRDEIDQLKCLRPSLLGLSGIPLGQAVGRWESIFGSCQYVELSHL